MRLTESQRGEAFDRMIRRQESARDIPQLPEEWAMEIGKGDDFLAIIAGAAAAFVVAGLSAIIVIFFVYGARVVCGGG
jgi:hypothetical protein